MIDELDIEEQRLCDRLNAGEITNSEFNREMNELRRWWRGMAEEAAQEAYDREMDNW